MAKIIDGAIQVQVNAQLHVDEQTFNACMCLIKIYAKERDINKMLLRFDDEMCLGYEVHAIKNEDNLYCCPLCYQEIKREVE